MLSPRCVSLTALAAFLAACALTRAAASDSADEDGRILAGTGVGSDGPSLLAHLAGRTLTPDVRAQTQALFLQLGSEEYDERQRATAALTGMGPVILPELPRALRAGDLEVRRRAERVAESLEARHDARVTEAVIHRLAAVAPAGAVAALLAYLPAARGEGEVAAVRVALARLAVRDGRPTEELLAALKSSEPACRGLAADLVASAGRDYRPAVRPLLADVEPGVRLRAALALATGGVREAVPVLVALQGELPDGEDCQAEEALFRLAGDDPPELPAPGTPHARRARREAWELWWARNGDRADLARLSSSMPLGFTLAVTFHAGAVRASEYGPDGRARWSVGGLDNAVDARVVAGKRVLVAEYGASRVTERTFDNRIVWEKRVAGRPIQCERRADGPTFIVTTTGLVEVDRAGREVWARDGLSLRAAHQYADGRVGLVTAAGEYQCLERDGKVGRRFATGVNIGNTLGGIDFLPDGGLLVGRPDRVVELDAAGKEVWTLKVDRASCPTRLADGNTLVARAATREFVEYDRAGRIVRSLKVDGEPWLARRR